MLAEGFFLIIYFKDGYPKLKIYKEENSNSNARKTPDVGI